MECIAVSQEANTLHVKLKYTHSIDSEVLKKIESSKYICGALFTEFEFTGSRGINKNNSSYSNCYLTVSVRFHKLLENDDIIYKCQFESSETKLLVKELRIYNENWHQIAFISKNSLQNTTVWSFTFDVTLNCEIVKCPCIFASLYDNTESADFKLCGYDDASVKIHKTILAAHSPVLQTMVLGEWKESKEGSVKLQGVTLETLQHLKDYMYLNSLPETETGLQELCVLASYYLMPNLVVQCCVKLLNQLTIENAIEMAEFASRYRVGPLYIAILKAMRGDTALTSAKIDKLVLSNKTNWMDVCKKINTTE